MNDVWIIALTAAGLFFLLTLTPAKASIGYDNYSSQAHKDLIRKKSGHLNFDKNVKVICGVRGENLTPIPLKSISGIRERHQSRFIVCTGDNKYQPLKQAQTVVIHQSFTTVRLPTHLDKSG